MRPMSRQEVESWSANFSSDLHVHPPAATVADRHQCRPLRPAPGWRAAPALPCLRRHPPCPEIPGRATHLRQMRNGTITGIDMRRATLVHQTRSETVTGIAERLSRSSRARKPDLRTAEKPLGGGGNLFSSSRTQPWPDCSSHSITEGVLQRGELVAKGAAGQRDAAQAAEGAQRGRRARRAAPCPHRRLRDHIEHLELARTLNACTCAKRSVRRLCCTSCVDANSYMDM